MSKHSERVKLWRSEKCKAQGHDPVCRNASVMGQETDGGGDPRCGLTPWVAKPMGEGGGFPAAV
jgi:hypothetical protein